MPTTTTPRRFTNEPWEVEEDITFAEITERRRNDSRELVSTLREDTNLTRKLCSEVEYLRSFNIDDNQRAADYLGISIDDYERSIAPRFPNKLSDNDRITIAAFERVIAEGRPFCVTALPTPDNEALFSAYVKKAVKEGRIRKEGIASKRTNVILWQPTTGAMEAAA